MEKIKTIAIIPARGGSKRLPKKNVLNLDGKPLIAHSIRYALEQNDIIDAVYVSTDDAEIKAISLKYGAQVIDRPSTLSNDTASTLSVLQHAVDYLELSSVDIVLLQPTNPLRPKTLLKDAFNYYVDHNQASLFTVNPLVEKLGSIDANKFVPANYEFGQRSQDMKPLYYENGLLYIAKSQLITDGHLMTEDSFPFIIDHIYGTVDIDTEKDFAYAKFILETYS